MCWFKRRPRKGLLILLALASGRQSSAWASGKGTSDVIFDYFPWVLGATVLCLLAVAGTLIKKYPDSYWESIALGLLLLAIGITVFLEGYLML